MMIPVEDRMSWARECWSCNANTHNYFAEQNLSYDY